MGRRWRVWNAVLVLAMLMTGIAGAGSGQTAAPAVLDLAGDPEVLFVENVGQYGEGPRFLAWGSERSIWLAEDAIWITLSNSPEPGGTAKRETDSDGHDGLTEETAELTAVGGVSLKLSFVGANPRPRLEPFNRSETRVSYFLGNDPAQWHADVPVWGGVRYVDLYSGIDLVVAGGGGRVVQRIVARDGADLSQVRLRVDGADDLTVDGDVLRLTTVIGEYALPLLQVSSAAGRPGLEGSQVAQPFAQQPEEDARSAMVDSAIDLRYATYLGGALSDYGKDCVDLAGNLYVAGYTESTGFPTTVGAYDTSHNGAADAFVSKLNPTGTALVYSTFIGGTSSDNAYSVAVASTGEAYVVGDTGSNDFPTTAGAYDTSYNTNGDAFVTKLNATGTALTYSTYLGGSNGETAYGVAEALGSAYVTGQTSSSNFPTTAGAYQTTRNGTQDAFVTQLNATGTALTYSTFLGGGSSEGADSIALDVSRNAYVCGSTTSSDFPTVLGAFDTTYNLNRDAFVSQLSATGSTLNY